jgi:uncharacterized protein
MTKLLEALNNVTLLDGIFKESQDKGKEYLVYLDVDRLMAPCYEAAGQEAKQPRYGGWESTGIAGHSVGHWLSAAATMYSVTKDPILLQKLEYAVDELAYVQSLDSDGYVSGFPRNCFDITFTGDFQVDNFGLAGGWVPWYSIHKIYAGLIDTYHLTGKKKALEVLIKLADWAKKGTDSLTDEQFQRMLTCEHGGMNEAMADLYLITKNQDYLNLAIRFCHQAILEPLAKQIDELQGKHANTQIPKVIGAAKLYEITGEEKYRTMAEFFWNQVTRHRSYVIGGNSNAEHFGPQDTEELGITTTETCNTYNMLKLTEHLFHWTHNAEYMDYYEKALYNHILASQDPDSGMKTYFVSTQPGHFKVYCSPDNSFWCCTGTGMENPARYPRNIYYRDNHEIYVNLFIASKIESGGTILVQETNFPESDKTTLIFERATGEASTVFVRVPCWTTGPVTVTINGQEVVSESENRYLAIHRQWNTGDQVEVQIPMGLHLSHTKNDSRKAAILYGPVVLAGALGREQFPETDILGDHLKLNNHPLIDVPSLITGERDVSKWVNSVQGADPLTFETEAIGQPGNVTVTLIPFYKLHHQRYTLYWNLMDEESYRTFVDNEKEEADRLRAITIDVVNPHEQQPEIEHSIKKENSRSGYFNLFNKGWRDTFGEGFFSYEMAVIPDKPVYLLVSYNGYDNTMHIDGKAYERDFGILIDNTLIAEVSLRGEQPGKLFEVIYDIPQQLTNGKEKVEVKFTSQEGKMAGGVYEVRTVNTK